MLARLVEVSLRQRMLVFLGALVIAAWGWNSWRGLPIDAFPDVAPTQVLVSLRVAGLTPEELESRVTVPVELAMTGTPGLVRMRSTTRYSVALLTFEFAEGTDIFWARTQVNERLAGVMGDLPQRTQGGLAPIVTPLAEMLMFTLSAPGLTPEAQRGLVDWVIRPALRGVPGVADINVLGGSVRTYEVVPSPQAMAARGISTQALEEAIGANNRNDGPGRVRDGEEALLVRAEGRIETLDDVRGIVVAARPTGIVRVADVAEVRFGALPRNGVVTRDGEGEAVWGIVLGLRGADARRVVDGVKARLPAIRAELPKGVTIDLFYDRAELIGAAVWTVQKVLLEAVALVVVLLLLFLGNLRAALVVSAILPLAVLATFGIMSAYGLSANIMSLGGLAIAIGLLVDCAVVVVENAAHRLAHGPAKPTPQERLAIVLGAVREVSVPLVSGVIIIVTVFTPLLSLQGLEGRLFGPVALTIGFALIAALLLSLTVVPALCVVLLKPGPHKEPWLVRRLHALYDPLIGRALRAPWVVAALAATGLAIAVVVFPRIGSTFMPVMDEGTPVISLRKHPTINVDEAADTDLRIQREIMARVPEVRGIMARAGADELGLDPVGLNESDMFLTLAPKAEWRQPSIAWVMGQVREVLDGFPGLSFAFAQPIDMRVQEMIIGARGDVVIKVFGRDIAELNRIATEVATTLRRLQGATDVFALRNEGMKYLTVRVDRLAAGRLGLNAADVQEALRIWVDGRQVGLVIEPTGARVPLALRGDESLRRSAADLARTPVPLPGGGTVPLSQIATIMEDEGAIQVVREDAARFATVLANVRGRDLVGFVAEAEAAVAAAVPLPAGYRLAWGGQFENQQRAAARLAIVVPMALSVIFLLLYLTFGSLRQAVLVFCNVPFAAIGGIVALWASGEFLSVPASVGFIALIGIAVLNGVVLVSAINSLLAEGLSRRAAVEEGAKRRLVPVVLTAVIAALALVPFLFATGPGAEIQRPLAIVVIGGLVTATLLTLMLLPILFDRFSEGRAPVGAPALAGLLLALWAAPAGALPPDHLERAMALDAAARGIEADRRTAASRDALARAAVPGSLSVNGSLRVDTRGLGVAREADLGLGAPLWLPGQRAAVVGSIAGDVGSAEARLELRRLEVAGALREAWWEAAARRAEVQVARARLTTARDLARDLRRRLAQGDVPEPDLLLAEGEVVAAELGLSQAEAAAAAARAAYAVLTGGVAPGAAVERPGTPGRHPALLAAEAGVAAADARAALVAATLRDNPELGGFIRGQEGSVTEQGVSLGLVLRAPLGSEARNAPRRAEAEAERTRATATLAATRRQVEAATAAAEAELRAAETARGLAQRRLGLAERHLTAQAGAFRAGEIGFGDLVRARVTQTEAASAAAQAVTEVGRARARLNQALGVLPGG